MEMFNGRPGDRRNFVHKRIIGAIGGAIGGVIKGGPLGGIGGAIGGFAGGGRSQVPTTTVVPGQTFAPQRCPPGFFTDTSGQCVPLTTGKRGGISGAIQRFLPGGETGLLEFGEAVNGQFGVALEPGFRDCKPVAVCPRGAVLGSDGLCYNKSAISNKNRMWPMGRKPLLTGGEMRCISIAAGAAKRLERKQKQLQKMGMLKKPSTSRRRALPSGHHAHVAHDGSEH